jgi:UDP-N-acetylglucosamine 2-epimerase
MVDSICDKLFTPSKDAVDNLINENIISDKISNVGNIMIDTLLKIMKLSHQKIVSNPGNLTSIKNILF